MDQICAKVDHAGMLKVSAVEIETLSVATKRSSEAGFLLINKQLIIIIAQKQQKAAAIIRGGGRNAVYWKA